MRAIVTIARRELSGLFFSPIAYVVLGLFALGSGLIFLMGFRPNEPAALRGTLAGVIWLMIFLVPAISMRLVSDEFRQGTIEPLMTSPLSDAQAIVGKWLGALGFFCVLLLPLLLMTLLLEVFGSPDYGPVLTGLGGLVLVGGLYLAVGIFASAFTENQIIAFLLTVFIICLFTLATFFLANASFIPSVGRGVIQYLNVNAQFDDFTKGLIDTSDLVFFVSGIAFFLFLATKVLESRRWR